MLPDSQHMLVPAFVVVRTHAKIYQHVKRWRLAHLGRTLCTRAIHAHAHNQYTNDWRANSGAIRVPSAVRSAFDQVRFPPCIVHRIYRFTFKTKCLGCAMGEVLASSLVWV